jgi:F-type H+-transporting ATPase subunit delta
MGLLREISQEAALLLDESMGIQRAEITSAQPLSDADQKQLAQKFSEISGKQVRLNVVVNPNLIGGIVARVGPEVYDGSVRGRLQAIGERLAAE